MIRSALLILTVPACLAAAQTSQGAPPKAATVVVWTSGDPKSDQILRGGLPVRILVDDGVAVSASLIRNEDVLWASVSVTNRSGNRVDVDPSQFTLTEVVPGKKELHYESPQQIVKFIQRRANWANGFAAMAGDMAHEQTTTEVRSSTRGQSNTKVDLASPNGSSLRGNATTSSSSQTTATVTTVGPDYQAKMESAKTIARTTATADAKSVEIVRRALLANTLMPGEDVGGSVFFERDKKAQEAILRLPIGGRIFEFALTVR